METKRTGRPGSIDLTLLGRDKLETLMHELRKGTSPNVLAQTVQSEWGMYKEIKLDTLSRHLRRWMQRKFLLPLAAVFIEDPKEKEYILTALRDKVDVLKELEELLKHQKTRLGMVMASENKLNVPMEMGNKIIASMKDLLVVTAKHQFDIGVLEFKGPTPNALVNIDQRGSADADPVNEAAQKVLAVLEGEFKRDSE